MNDDRVALVPAHAPRLEGLRSVFDFQTRVRDELERCFLEAVVFQGKELKTLVWGGPDDAIALVRASRSDGQPVPS